MSNKEREGAAPDEVQTELPAEEIQEPTLEEKYAQALADIEELKKDNLRVLADSENFKKRLLREKEEYFKFATSAILEEIIPVMDNLDLALAHGRQAEACKDLVMGVEMTMNIFLDTMKKHGLEQIGAVDVPFDPAMHYIIEQFAQFECHLAGLAAADLTEIDLGDNCHLGSGAGQEKFFADVGFGAVDRTFDNRDLQFFARQLEHGAAGDALQDIVRDRRGDQHAIAHHENVHRRALRDVTIVIKYQGLVEPGSDGVGLDQGRIGIGPADLAARRNNVIVDPSPG